MSRSLMLVPCTFTVFLAGCLQPPGPGDKDHLAKFASPEELAVSEVVEQGGNVGIGTPAPQAKLHLSDPGDVKLRLEGKGVASDIVGHGGGINYNVGADKDHTFVSGDSDIVKIGATGLHVLTGKVGIGTTTPSASLHVLSGNVRFQGTGAEVFVERNSDDSAAHSLTLQKSRGSSSSPAPVQSADLLGTVAWEGYSGGARGYVSGARIEAYVETPPANGDMPTYMRFGTTPVGSTNSMERMRISSSGNVGIGTTTPDEKLAITGGNIRVSQNSGQSGGMVIVAGSTGPGPCVASGTGSCTQEFGCCSCGGKQGAMTYDQTGGANRGHFYGCRGYGGGTGPCGQNFCWVQLDN